MVADYRKLIFAAMTGAALLFTMTGVTAGHTGSVVASETCQSWSVTVSLANDVTTDRTVVVVTTIPGTQGIAGNHYGTSFGQIWSASGVAPATGTVTLNIYKGAKLEFTTSGSIAPAKDCGSPSPAESFQGETATPTIDPTETPFESFQGETATPGRIATPPPTSSGSGSSGNSSTPLIALLICLAFGGLGLAAVEAQRRTIRR